MKYDGLITQKIDVVVGGKNASYYQSKGYILPTGNNTKEQFSNWLHDKFNRSLDEISLNNQCVVKSRLIHCYEDNIDMPISGYLNREHNLDRKLVRAGIYGAIRLKHGYYGKHYIYTDDYIKEHPEYKINYVEDDKDEINIDKAIICLNDLCIFKSRAAARYYYNLSKNIKINDCCKGERKTSGIHPILNEPMKWMYLKDYVRFYNKSIVEKYHSIDEFINSNIKNEERI